jgi:hypothetical protein
MTVNDLRRCVESEERDSHWRSAAIGVVRSTARLLQLVTGVEPTYEVAARTAHLVARSRRAFDGLLTAGQAAAISSSDEEEISRLEGWGDHFFDLDERLRESISLALGVFGGIEEAAWA